MSFYANDIVFLQDVEQCLGPFLQRYTKISVGEEEDICKILYLCGLASIKLNDIPVQEATDLQKRCDRVKTLCDMVHYLARHTLSYPHNLVNDDDTSCYYKRLRSLCESREAYKPLISYEEMKVREREVFVVDPMHYVDDLEFLLRARYMISKYHLPTGSNKEKELKAMIDASDAALVKGAMYKGGVAFYVDAEPQISESLSNSTTQSQLAEKINSVSDLGREMQFLLGSNENLMPSMVTDTVHKDRKRYL